MPNIFQYFSNSALLALSKQGIELIIALNKYNNYRSFIKAGFVNQRISNSSPAWGRCPKGGGGGAIRGDQGALISQFASDFSAYRPRTFNSSKPKCSKL